MITKLKITLDTHISALKGLTYHYWLVENVSIIRYNHATNDLEDTYLLVIVG